MTEWSTFASLATAVGTLVLAAATFASIRSANRSARVSEFAARTAERSLLAAQRPLLVNSRSQEDPQQKVEFYEGAWHTLLGGGAEFDLRDGVIHMSASLRNVGTGLAVLHGWLVTADQHTERVHPPIPDFTEQIRDIYIAPGDVGYWLGALRDPEAAVFAAMSEAIKNHEMLTLYLLYGDFEGGQRVITQFAMRWGNERWRLVAGRHFTVDGPDPRHLDGNGS